MSKAAADVVAGCNVIILPLPSFAYRSVLEELKPHLKPGMHIGVTPGQGGFDWIARDVLGELCSQLVFFAIMPMPFNCRITEFGKAVAVQEFKRRYRIGTLPASAEPATLSICEQLLGPTEVRAPRRACPRLARGFRLSDGARARSSSEARARARRARTNARTQSCGHFLATTLYPINAIIHPQRLYSLCHPPGGKPWAPDNKLPENPLFYEVRTRMRAGTRASTRKHVQARHTRPERWLRARAGWALAVARGRTGGCVRLPRGRRARARRDRPTARAARAPHRSRRAPGRVRGALAACARRWGAGRRTWTSSRPG